MRKIRGTVDGIIIATYKKDKFTWTCKKSGIFYCATFHNGRQSATTYYSKDNNEINDLIKQEIISGYKRI